MLNCVVCCTKMDNVEENKTCVCYICINIYGTWRCNNCDTIFSDIDVYNVRTNKNTPCQDMDMYCSNKCLVEANPIMECSYCKSKYRLSEGYMRYNEFVGYCSSICDRLDCM